MITDYRRNAETFSRDIPENFRNSKVLVTKMEVACVRSASLDGTTSRGGGGGQVMFEGDRIDGHFVSIV